MLLWFLFALHALLGAALGFSVDEAHYALYAAHPAWSYFDHPPLVGWVQWPLVVLQVPDAVLRLVPGALWLVTLIGVYRLTLRLQVPDGEGAALWALLALLLAPLLHILGIGLLPDTLLMALTIALMHHTLTLMESDGPPPLRHWLLLGVLLGLAGLSKYTAIFAAVSVAVCLLRVYGLRMARMPGVWLATLLALIMVGPVLVWNAQNQWISFRYQSEHGAGGLWRLQDVVRFLLVQVLVFGPLLWWGLAGMRRHTLGPQRWLALFFVFPFVMLAYLSGGGTSLPHWTAPAWVALAPFAGLALARTAQSRWRPVVAGLAFLQAVFCLALPLLMFTGGIPFVQAKAPDSTRAPNPFADLHGWDQAGARARQLTDKHQLSSIAVQNWTLASRMGWYARPVQVHVLDDRFDQFDLWAADLSIGENTLLVDWSEMAYVIPRGAHGFADCQLLESLPVMRLGSPLSEFRFYACRGWSGNPQPRLLSESVPP